jgi:5-histidylcysteine sulfoxide synthase
MITSPLTRNLFSLPPVGLKDLKRNSLLAYFDNTWELYEMLFSSINNEKSLYLAPDPLRNPLIFYLGHTAAFYVNKLKATGLITEGVHEQWDQLFAVGVDPDTPEKLDVSDYWPTVEETRGYRQTIYHMVHEVLNSIEAGRNASWDNALWAIFMSLEHDRIHFETSSVLIRQLDARLVDKPAGWKYAPSSTQVPEQQWIAVEAGEVKLGKPQDDALYGWDNEYGSLTVKVAPFEATKNLITNAEYLCFFNAGGYEEQRFWTTEGWDWKQRTDASYPKFWVKKSEGVFAYRAMFDEIDMPMDWPVEVNAHEAQAYINWLGNGARLLTEAEFALLSRKGLAAREEPFEKHTYNINVRYASPTPVGFMQDGDSPAGFSDLWGNVWDWLSDDFYPLPGFRVHPWYPDFSEPYMDHEHGMMAGGSWATTGTGASKYYRLWFRRHFFQHAGFRLARG